MRNIKSGLEEGRQGIKTLRVGGRDWGVGEGFYVAVPKAKISLHRDANRKEKEARVTFTRPIETQPSVAIQSEDRRFVIKEGNFEPGDSAFDLSLENCRCLFTLVRIGPIRAVRLPGSVCIKSAIEFWGSLEGPKREI